MRDLSHETDMSTSFSCYRWAEWTGTSGHAAGEQSHPEQLHDELCGLEEDKARDLLGQVLEAVEYCHMQRTAQRPQAKE